MPLAHLAAYWSFGAAAATVLMLHPSLPSAEGASAPGCATAAAAGAGALTAAAYHALVHRGCASRPLDTATLIVFPVFNGVFETTLFAAAFRGGAAIARAAGSPPIGRFLAGTTTFFAFSGLIHALFWLRILPPHMPETRELPPRRKALKRAWAFGLGGMSFAWAWLLHAHDALRTVTWQHILFDAAMVASVRCRIAWR